eukprot:gene15864-biopygen18745
MLLLPGFFGRRPRTRCPPIFAAEMAGGRGNPVIRSDLSGPFLDMFSERLGSDLSSDHRVDPPGPPGWVGSQYCGISFGKSRAIDSPVHHKTPLAASGSRCRACLRISMDEVARARTSLLYMPKLQQSGPGLAHGVSILFDMPCSTHVERVPGKCACRPVCRWPTTTDADACEALCKANRTCNYRVGAFGRQRHAASTDQSSLTISVEKMNSGSDVYPSRRSCKHR